MTAPPLTSDELRATHDAELRRAGELACNADPELFRSLLDQHAGKWKGEVGHFRRLIQYIHRVAGKQSGFPAFTDWLLTREQQTVNIDP